MNETKCAAQIVQSARNWIGTPYLHQASLKGAGCDCLGLIRGIWREIQGAEPTPPPVYSSSWAEFSREEKLLQAAHKFFIPRNSRDFEPGDILLFRMKPGSIAKHLGIAATDKSFVHAYDKNAVTESALADFWKKRIVAAFQFPKAADEVHF